MESIVSDLQVDSKVLKNGLVSKAQEDMLQDENFSSKKMENIIKNLTTLIKKDPVFKNKLIDKALQRPDFRKMFVELIVKEIAD
ncbi:hypothetical protein GMMP15_1700050 [Candidatus Magnetomoraceae bacterium gMMP-15]